MCFHEKDSWRGVTATRFLIGARQRVRECMILGGHREEIRRSAEWAEPMEAIPTESAMTTDWRLSLLLLVIGILEYSGATECEVSKWSDWSRCFGDCTNGVAVRNRDVLVPPLPLLAPNGSLFQTASCPHLYETKACTPNECYKNLESMPTPGPLMDFEHSLHRNHPRPIAEVSSTKERPLNDTDRLLQMEKIDKIDKIDNIRMEKGRLARVAAHPRGKQAFSDAPSTTTAPPETFPTLIHENTSEFEVDADLNYKTTPETTNNNDQQQQSIDIPSIKQSTKLGKTDKTRLAVVDSESEAQKIHRKPRIQLPAVYAVVAKELKKTGENEEKSIIPIEHDVTTTTASEELSTTTTVVETSTTSEASTSLRQDSGTVADTTTQDPPYYVNSLTIDIPMQPKITPTIEKNLMKRLNITRIGYRNFGEPSPSTESPMNDVLKQLESAADLNIPLDDKHIRKALRKNRKLMRALVEAYKYRKNVPSNAPVSIHKWDDESSSEPRLDVSSAASAETPAGDVTASDFGDVIRPSIPSRPPSIGLESLLEPAAFQNAGIPTKIDNGRMIDGDVTTTGTTTTTEEVGTTAGTMTTTEVPSTTTSPPYWPKRGYVPNTRKHASEITSKLYMTHEIIQALSDEPIRRSPVLRLDCLENRRCCKIERTECPGGDEPKLTKRFYRPPGSSICIPYNYPACSQLEEMEEQPIQFEQNCQDICFAGPEKRISPLLEMNTDN